MAIAEADLAINKFAELKSVMAGDDLLYTLVVSNVGTTVAEQIPGQTQILVIDNMPPELENAIYSLDEGLSWDVWSGSVELTLIEPGDSVSILLQATVKYDAEGVISNTASVEYNLLLGGHGNFDPDTSNNTSELDVPIDSPTSDFADLSITKTSDVQHLMRGDMVVYTLLAENKGPSDVEVATITDALPFELENVEFSADMGLSWAGWAGSYIIPNFTAGSKISIFVRATVAQNAVGQITNEATVESETPDPDLSNNTSTLTIPITDACDQAITDLIQSVALQETALSHILNAEGEKMQLIISTPTVTQKQLMDLNNSVNRLLNSVTRLEIIMQSKLGLFK